MRVWNRFQKVIFQITSREYMDQFRFVSLLGIPCQQKSKLNSLILDGLPWITK